MPDGLMDHVGVTAPPFTRAVNCWVWPPFRVTEVGDIRTVLAGTKFTVALFDHAESAASVAVTVTVWAAATDDGAVYSPAALTLPTPAGTIVQTAPGFAGSAISAVNCWVSMGKRLALDGDTCTEPRDTI